MTFSKPFVAALFGVVALLGASPLTAGIVLAEGAYPDAKQIVSVGGTVTEILYALDSGDRIKAVDTTSSFPAAASNKPNVGYMRALSAEGILAQNPDLILAEQGSGPPGALSILTESGIPMVTIPSPPSVDGIAPKIRAVGAAVGKEAPASLLADKVSAELQALKEQIAGLKGAKKRVLFALSLANGRVMAGGSGTAADAIITLAGGINAASAVTGYKPLSDEAVIEAAPDVLLVMNNSAMHMTAEQAFALPALQSSPAGKANAFVAMDGLYLIGLGPRTPQAGRELAAKLYPDAIKP